MKVTRNKQIGIRLSKAEHRQISRQAKKVGLSAASWLRVLGMRESSSEQTTSEAV